MAAFMSSVYSLIVMDRQVLSADLSELLPASNA